MWSRQGAVGWRKHRGKQQTALVQWLLSELPCLCACVCALVGLLAWLTSCVGRIGLFPEPPRPSILEFPYHSPQPPLSSSHAPRELPSSPWWKRRASCVVAGSLHAAGQHHFDLHTQTGANSSAMPPLGAIMSFHPSRYQVGVQWCGESIL